MSLFRNVRVVYYYVGDWERAKAFYANVLEWPIVWVDDAIGWAEYGYEDGLHIAINRWSETGSIPPHTGGAVAVLNNEDHGQDNQPDHAEAAQVLLTACPRIPWLSNQLFIG